MAVERQNQTHAHAHKSGLRDGTVHIRLPYLRGFISPQPLTPRCLRPHRSGTTGSYFRFRAGLVACRGVGVASLDVARPFPILHFWPLPLNPTLSPNECRALYALCTHGAQQRCTECHDCDVVHPS
jgi:hypothetical protein